MLRDAFVLMRSGPVEQRTVSGSAHPWRGWTRGDVWAILLTAVAYYGGARIGLLPALVRGQVTPFWPPTGIAVACLLLFGMRTWPGVAAASLAVNIPLGPTLPAVAGIVAGNT